MMKISGYSLIEMMVVLAILGVILMGIAITLATEFQCPWLPG